MESFGHRDEMAGFLGFCVLGVVGYLAGVGILTIIANDDTPQQLATAACLKYEPTLTKVDHDKCVDALLEKRNEKF